MLPCNNLKIPLRMKTHTKYHFGTPGRIMYLCMKTTILYACVCMYKGTFAWKQPPCIYLYIKVPLYENNLVCIKVKDTYSIGKLELIRTFYPIQHQTYTVNKSTPGSQPLESIKYHKIQKLDTTNISHLSYQQVKINRNSRCR